MGGNRLFSVVPSNRIKGNGHKLKHRKFHLYMRKNLVSVGMTGHWNSLPGDAVESPCLEWSLLPWKYS